jgi:endoglucanase
VLAACNIPGRDCVGESTGGAGSPQAHRDWITAFADGIGGKPAVVIIEPDALAQLDRLPGAARQTRLDLLNYARSPH